MYGSVAIGTVATRLDRPRRRGRLTSTVPLFFIGIASVDSSGDHRMSQGKVVAPPDIVNFVCQTTWAVATVTTSTMPEGPSAIAAYFSSGEIATPMKPVAVPTLSLARLPPECRRRLQGPYRC